MVNRKWEYTYRMYLVEEEFEKELNTLGSEGWELISVTSNLNAREMWFKREII